VRLLIPLPGRWKTMNFPAARRVETATNKIHERETMKRPDLSREGYSDFSAFARGCAPAHSGPELADCVPYPGPAQDLARELLSDQFELTHSAPPSSSGMAMGFTIGLARR